MRFRLRQVLPAAALAVLATLATATAASPAGTIVVYGARSGSHLVLSSQGSRLVVEGNMARTRPHGCRLQRDGMRAVCSLRGVSAIELQMGPSGDLVEVANKLPVSLVAHLGGGSDKFIGNGERDTCYSEGARRNRCVGGPGNDVCITGQQNSDCVGGAGNDYCRTGAGSDGCWGGPGNDVCIMGPGEDGCHGEAGNDKLYGGPGADQLYGGSGWNYCDGLPGIGKSHECSAGPGH
jgi:Ca2+-binding RTX toxin-like protein